MAGNLPYQASATKPALQQLLKRDDLWQGFQRPSREVVSTGRADLDASLPTGGWPRGRLVELLPRSFGLGELGLLLPALAGEARRDRPVVFANPPLIPCPQGLSSAGFPLSRLVVLRKPASSFWATEQCLKSGLCGAVLLWHPPGRVDPRSIRRLQLAAENGPALVFVWYQPEQTPPPSIAALRLAIHPGPTLSVLRGNHTRNAPIRLGPDNVVNLGQARLTRHE